MPQQSGMSMLALMGIFAAVLLVFGGALYAWLRPDPRVAMVWAVAALVGLAIPAALLLKFNRQEQFQTTMQQQGLRGVATVLRVQGTDMLINRRPQVRLQLRIELAGEPHYEQELLALVPLGRAVAPGQRLPVFVNPDHRSSVMLDWEQAAPGAPAQTSTAPVRDGLAQRLAQLDEARQQGLVSQDEYDRERARLLAEH